MEVLEPLRTRQSDEAWVGSNRRSSPWWWSRAEAFLLNFAQKYLTFRTAKNWKVKQKIVKSRGFFWIAA